MRYTEYFVAGKQLYSFAYYRIWNAISSCETSKQYDYPSIVVDSDTGETICEYRGDDVREVMKDGN